MLHQATQMNHLCQLDLRKGIHSEGRGKNNGVLNILFSPVQEERYLFIPPTLNPYPRGSIVMT